MRFLSEPHRPVKRRPEETPGFYLMGTALVTEGVSTVLVKEVQNKDQRLFYGHSHPRPLPSVANRDLAQPPAAHRENEEAEPPEMRDFL